MKSRRVFFPVVFFCFAFLFTGVELSAFGREEAAAKDPVNTEWVLCVTALDVSALPLSRQIIGGTVTGSLAGGLPGLSIRFRGEEEAAYYRDYAWAKSRSASAAALASKRNERDLLIYKGEPSWKYRKNLKTVDEAITKLEEELAVIDASAPAVERAPVFTLTEENRNGTYPAAPEPGGEYRFCAERKADAFLAGSLSEYHGRIYLEIKMYTLYTHSYSFEDSVLFSSEDLDGALDEISGRLAGAVSDTLPSALRVHAEPREAIVLIDGSYAGTGETETRLHSPGNAEIEIRSDNHVPVSVPVELNPGELAELFIDLTPLGYSAFEADVAGSPGSRVYLGSRYAGQTPLTLELPKTDFAYISVETPGGEVGSAVLRDNRLVRGSAEFARMDDSSGRADFFTKVPVSPEEKRVDRARRGFYGVYGAFWVILPVSLLAGGIAGTYISANEYAVQQSDRAAYDKVHDTAVMNQYIKNGSTALWVTALGVTLFQVFRYLYASGSDSTPIVKHKSPEPSTEQEQAAGGEISPGEISPPDTGEQP